MIDFSNSIASIFLSLLSLSVSILHFISVVCVIVVCVFLLKMGISAILGSLPSNRKLREKEIELNSTQEKLKEYESEHKEFQRQVERAEYYKDLSEKNSSAELERTKLNLQNVQSQLNGANQRLQTMENDLKKAYSDLDDAENEIKRLKQYKKESPCSLNRQQPSPQVTIGLNTQKHYPQAVANLQSLFYNSYDVSKMLENAATGLHFENSRLSLSHIEIESFVHSIHDDGTQNVYRTSLSKCDCPFYKGKNTPCKHMLFLAYNLGVLQINAKDNEEKRGQSTKMILENAQIIQEQKRQIRNNEQQLDRLYQKKAKAKKAAPKAAPKNKQSN